MLAPTTLTRIATASQDRVLRAIQALEDGSLTCQLTSAHNDKITAIISSAGKPYTVLLAPHHTECSCPDSHYREVICKHQIALALWCEKAGAGEQTQEWQAAA